MCKYLQFVLAASVGLCLTLPAGAQTSVVTWHYDNLRTGANTAETILTPGNVNVNTFGKLFVLPTDGNIIGQALYLPNISIPNKATHNVVYVATMHDSVYAFDADNNQGANAAPLWQVSLLPAGGQASSVPISVQGCGGVTHWTEVGVVSTPVIDASTSTLYVVAKSYENGVSIHRLHALDVATGQEKFGGPVSITAFFNHNGKTYTFNNESQVNRPGLLLANGRIYIAFGSNGCNGTEQGWILSYDASTLLQEGAFNDEPGSNLAAIWQKGAGLSADADGNIYGETAEGKVTPGVHFGTSIMKVSQSASSLQLADWFTPQNYQYLNDNDLDLNDSVLLLPDQPGPHPHLAIGVGKEGTLYVLDRDSMGHLCSTCAGGDTQIVQELPNAVGKETGSLVYWNSTIYSSGVSSPVMAWTMSNGVLASTPLAKSSKASGMHSPVITANGNTNGILWQINGSNLTAYNALTLAKLYVSAQTNGRDTLPTLPHFANFMAANGKLYIGTASGLAVFGLL